MRIRTSVQAHLSALCLSTIMSSNCSPAFNRWMTGYFTFQQTAAMRIRWMEKWKSFFRIGRKSSRHRKSRFAPKMISKPKPRQDSIFFNRDEKSGKKRECHFPGMESTFPLYFSSPYFCREWNRDKNRNSRVIFFLELESTETGLAALSMSTSSLPLLLWLWSSSSSLLSSLLLMLLLWSSSLPRWLRG